MTFQFTVPNIACSACAGTIRKAIKAIDPQATVQAEPKTKQVSVATQTSELKIKQAVVDAGYTVI